jgi:hypothetical protein
MHRDAEQARAILSAQVFVPELSESPSTSLRLSAPL